MPKGSRRFVQVEVDFYRHRKTLRLKRRIGVDAYWVPPRLWAYCIERENADITEFDPMDLADILGYEGDPVALVEALVDAGFIIDVDGRRVVAGWDERYGEVFAFYADRARRAANARWNRDQPPSSEQRPEKKETRGEGDNNRKHDQASFKNATSIDEASDSCLLIYDAYPRKVARSAALKAINAVLRGGMAFDALLARTRAYASATAHWTAHDQQFIPHPATWFNRGSFDDDPATWERNYAGPHHQPAPTAEDHVRESAGWGEPR